MPIMDIDVDVDDLDLKLLTINMFTVLFQLETGQLGPVSRFGSGMKAPAAPELPSQKLKYNFLCVWGIICNELI